MTTPDQPTATATPVYRFSLASWLSIYGRTCLMDFVKETDYATLERELSSAQAALAEAKAEVARLNRRDGFDLQQINRVVADQTSQLRAAIDQAAQECAKNIEANHVWGRQEPQRIKERAAIIAAAMREVCEPLEKERDRYFTTLAGALHAGYFDGITVKELREPGEKLITERDRLRAALDVAEGALKPFSHPDLAKPTTGNAQGDSSPVFGRDKAVLTIADFKAAQHALARIAELRK